MNTTTLRELSRISQSGEPVSEELAMAVLTAKPQEMPEILTCTNTLRLRCFGSAVHLCSIINAKSGSCEQDCAFCAQSARHSTKAETYDMFPPAVIKEAFKKAEKLPVDHFGVVTSGGILDRTGVDTVAEILSSTDSDTVHWCVSLGGLDKQQLYTLKNAGLKRFHHNVETAESFFPAVCSTHAYRDRIEMIRRVKEVGLEICSGGILGLGESPEQRIELAAALHREQVDSIPLNFLIPVEGTRLERREVMKPLDIIRSIMMFRLMNPEAELKVCAGRVHLRDLQSMIFYAGATGMMIGPLLTVAGRDVNDDLQMLKDLEIEYGL